MTDATPPAPAHTRVGPRSAVLLGVVTAGVLAGSVLNLWEVDRVVYVPGPVYDTLGEINGTSVISVDQELDTFDTDGHLYFTTIRLRGGPGDPLSAWDWLRAELDSSATVVSRQDVFPDDVTSDQVREQNTELMLHSQDDAAVVALRATGLEIAERVVVAQVIVDAPADGVLHVDDQITQVAGLDVADAEGVRNQIQEVTPGQTVPITLMREGEEVTLDVPTTEDEETGRTIVGVYLAPVYDNPHDVTIDAGNVGGPSAGLMFSLAVYDEITPGPLTQGLAVAGTGTITGNGDVGGIGGVTQKMYAAQEADAQLFLVPASNCDEVVGAEPAGLVVAPVATFEEALQVMETVAGHTDGDLSDLDLPVCDQVMESAHR